MYLSKISLLAIFFLFTSIGCSQTQISNSYITTDKSELTFVLSENGSSQNICASSNDFPGVLRAIHDLQNDIKNVSNSSTNIELDKTPADDEIIIIGTLNKNPLLDQLITNNKIDVSSIKGKWETFLIQVVENPLPNVKKALVIAGSDKRGTIYGIYDLSEKIGVSPWYWWADVPVKKKESIYVLPGEFSNGEPKVKYRGFFINDEAPALSGWSIAKYGTEQFNHNLYEHVFELILRLKGNFLWPAMWGRSLFDDDSTNQKLADEYGVVIGTSHHEPMMRAHVEWQRYGSGPWNYEKNGEELCKFWKAGIERMNGYESVVTLAMRGDGDEAMSDNANIGLLENIVKDQREIIGEVTGKDVTTIPQVWALYKEVQEYYDKGMRVPDDVTVLMCDDNWGNIRKLPKLKSEKRKGGFGIYYHYDYVGGPRNYKWLNTNQIERVWEQMRLAYEYGADELWIVNVGDIKPMEFPISFFLDYAWNPEKISSHALPGYYVNWATEQFGKDNAEEIAEILSLYTKYNSRIKPELLSPKTYSMTNYREWERVVEEYNDLLSKAEKLYKQTPQEYKDAFFELVLHPVEACANLNELYYATAQNYIYYEQGRASTNFMGEKVQRLFKKDADITNYYNNILAGGKWQHMMDQTHIGYTYWQQPDSNTIPELKELQVPLTASMGVSVEGSEEWFPKTDHLILPEFDKFSKQSFSFEIFNRGTAPFNYSIVNDKSFILFSDNSGEIQSDKTILVSIDWNKVPVGKNAFPITVKCSEESEVQINISVNNPDIKSDEQISGFVESNGFVSIDATNYTRKSNTQEANWEIVNNLGRTTSAVTPVPVTSEEKTPGVSSPCLEYDVYLFSSGEVDVRTYLSPTLNFQNRSEGIRYAVSFDDEQPQIVNITDNPNQPDLNHDPVWNKWVAENINIKQTKHKIINPGKHTLKIWMVDPGVVLQKIVIDTGGLKPSYLGPPESVYYKN